MAEGARRAAAEGRAKEEWQTNDTPPPAAITDNAQVLVKEVTKGAVHRTQSDIRRPHAGVPLKPSPRPPTKPLSLAGLCGRGVEIKIKRAVWHQNFSEYVFPVSDLNDSFLKFNGQLEF